MNYVDIAANAGISVPYTVRRCGLIFRSLELTFYTKLPKAFTF